MHIITYLVAIPPLIIPLLPRGLPVEIAPLIEPLIFEDLGLLALSKICSILVYLHSSTRYNQ